MDWSYSVTLDTNELNFKREQIQREVEYNYRTLTTDSISVNYSIEFPIEPEVSKEQLRKEYWPFLEPQPILSKLLIKTG